MNDETLDPRSLRQTYGPLLSQRPILTILFHPDLSRVGEQVQPEALVDGRWLDVGRTAPLFSGGSISDPTVSRSQFGLRWDAGDATFEVRFEPQARRPVTLIGPDGHPLTGAIAPQGSVVCIGDRVMLALAAVIDDVSSGDRLGMVGETNPIWALRARVRAVARALETALVTGETGVGKELVARAIHNASARRSGPYVGVNCVALPEQIVESELFGHRRGAFTGAKEGRPGLFRSADGGTLFLDEIGELPFSTQAKLLRALQEKVIRPVGETRELTVNVRIVAATNRDLEADVVAGRFREDLLARLQGLAVQVPPLRDRRSDVLLLFTHFLAHYGHERGASRLWQPASDAAPPIPFQFYRDLLTSDWPRNVRQVRKLAVEVAAVNDVEASHPFVYPEWRPAEAAVPTVEPRSLAPEGSSIDYRPPAELDEATVRGALEACEYVQRRAAEALGISRTSLDKLMQEWGFPRPSDISADDITAARGRAGDDPVALARALRVSVRGLKLRLRALDAE